MTIFVTGGAGFIGSNFVLDWHAAVTRARRQSRQAHLRRQPAEPGIAAPAVNDHVFVQGDIGDGRSLAAPPRTSTGRAPSSTSLPSATSIAASTGPKISSRPTWSARSSCCRRRCVVTGGHCTGGQAAAFRFLHVSTDEVYGSLGAGGRSVHRDAPVSSRTVPIPRARPRRDHLVRAYHHTYGLPVLTTNCSNNYGPYQFPEKLIPLMIHNALSGRAIADLRRWQQVRDWLYVGDHCTRDPPRARGRHARRGLQRRRLERKTNLAVVQTHLRAARRTAPRRGRPVACARSSPIVTRPPGPRPPLCDRRAQARARARLAAGGDLRDRHSQNRRVVSRQPRVGART